MLLPLTVLALAGCERAVAERPAQLLARVNGVEISSRQLAAAQGGLAQALERVIDRELLVQKALERGLERDARVAEAAEAARREALAQAYLDTLSGAATTPSRDAVRAFYAENPALFAERRIYRLRELSVTGSRELIETLRSQQGRFHGLDELAAWLKARGLRFSSTMQTQPAEQLPLAYLPRLARMKAGEIEVFPAPLGASVIQVVQAEDAPLGEAEAAGMIERFLAARRRLALAAEEIGRLRAQARIEYAAHFKR